MGETEALPNDSEVGRERRGYGANRDGWATSVTLAGLILESARGSNPSSHS